MNREFFDAAKEFDLEKHFDDTREPDARLRTHELYDRTKKTAAREREISLEVTLLIGLLEVKNAAVNLGLGKREYLAASLGTRLRRRSTPRKHPVANPKSRTRVLINQLM